MFGYLDNLRSPIDFFYKYSLRSRRGPWGRSGRLRSCLWSSWRSARRRGCGAAWRWAWWGWWDCTESTPGSQRGLWTVLFGSKLCMWDHNWVRQDILQVTILMCFLCSLLGWLMLTCYLRVCSWWLAMTLFRYLDTSAVDISYHL